ncbi:cytochrome c biogenesis heme-transporting ATPase CcmA [Pseudoduganella namucuonensis]|uniref:Heme exporter protein A n=1 Tax=Pseudoduganella namucuonensis TaxID=1035707 RepID=A0A1I7M670_9BURK|nr:cytochrome c biogenesis heme-transporting ATPase CcmA [Pseudoduganella namucuonensis]SFV17451.1 heme exporter protein A [Pseudoduganella namucuonensis]
MSAGGLALQAWGLACDRGGRRLFGGVDFTLGAGEALWIRGGNGSGKTSLMRLLCGLATPSEGEVRWCGEPVRRLREDYHRELLYCGHAAAVKDDLTAWENVAMASTLAGNACDKRTALRALELAGLGHAAALPARVLSQGQRRRVALARLHVAPLPSLLLLDEPFTALDTAAVEALSERIAEHLRQGGMAVYTTHQAHALQPIRQQVLDLDALADVPPALAERAAEDQAYAHAPRAGGLGAFARRAAAGVARLAASAVAASGRVPLPC